MAQKFHQKLVDIENRTVTHVLGNGLKVVCRWDDLSDAMKLQYGLHGISQKTGDAASNCAATLDYAQAFSNIQSVWDTTVGGAWSRKGGGNGVKDVVQAYADCKGVGIDEAEAFVESLDEVQMAKLLSNVRIKARILQIKADRANEIANASESDLDDILGSK